MTAQQRILCKDVKIFWNENMALTIKISRFDMKGQATTVPIYSLNIYSAMTQSHIWEDKSRYRVKHAPTALHCARHKHRWARWLDKLSL